MNEFVYEVRQMPTRDLILILEDQVDLYSEEELLILRAELASRPQNAAALEDQEQLRQEALADEQEALKQQAAARRAAQADLQRRAYERKLYVEQKVASLKAQGHDGYYEYTALSLADENSGGLSPELITQRLNDLALDGWKLVSSYSNELCHTAYSTPNSSTANATIDQHILIMERYVKI